MYILLLVIVTRFLLDMTRVANTIVFVRNMLTQRRHSNAILLSQRSILGRCWANPYSTCTRCEVLMGTSALVVWAILKHEVNTLVEPFIQRRCGLGVRRLIHRINIVDQANLID